MEHLTQSDHSRLMELKKQRFFLRIIVCVELIVAVTLTTMMLAGQIASATGAYRRRFTPSFSRLDKFFVFLSSNDLLQGYLFFAGIPLLCLILFFTLRFLIQKNIQDPIIHKECLWILLFGIFLPWLLRFFLFSFFTNTSFYTIYMIWFIAGLFLLNFILFRNLHQYTKAIRREKAKEANAAIADQTSIG